MTYSQFNIDSHLLEIFKNKTSGFFIEAGANDGLNQSNTFLLESVLKWNGLLVEPNIHRYNICKKTLNHLDNIKYLENIDFIYIIISLIMIDLLIYSFFLSVLFIIIYLKHAILYIMNKLLP